MEFLSHPIQTTGKVVRGIGAAQGAEYIKARQSFQRGDHAAAIGHGLSYLVPLFGPVVAQVVEESLETGNIALATGRLTELFSPSILGKATRGARGALSPRFLDRSNAPVDPSTVVPTTLSERLPTGPAQSVAALGERITERTLPGAAVFQPLREAQQRGLIQRGQNIVDDLSPTHRGDARAAGAGVQSTLLGQQGAFKATRQARLNTLADEVVEQFSPEMATPEGSGLLVGGSTSSGRGLRAVQDTLRQDASDAYAAIDEVVAQHDGLVRGTADSALVGPTGGALRTTLPIPGRVGGVWARTATIKQFAETMRRRIDRMAELVDPEELTGIRRQLDTISRSPDKVGFQAMQDARSALMGIARRLDDPVPGRSGGLAQQLASLANASMEKAAKDSGVPGLLDQVRSANAQWGFIKESFNETVIKKLLESAPERLPEYVRQADLSDIRRIRTILPAADMNELRAAIVRDMLDKGDFTALSAADTKSSLGGQLRSMGQDRLVALFGREAQQRLQRAAETSGPLKAGEVASFTRHGVVYRNLFNDTVIKKLLASSEEAVPELIRQSSAADIEMLTGMLSKSTLNDVRASIVGDILNKATTGEVPQSLFERADRSVRGSTDLGPTRGRQLSPDELSEALPSPGGEIAGNTLGAAIERIGAPQMRALFDNETSSLLTGLRDKARSVAKTKDQAANSLIAAGVNAALLGGSLSLPATALAAGGTAAAVAAGGVALLGTGMYAASKLFVRQPSTLRLYDRFLDAVNADNMGRATTTGLVLTRLIKEQERRDAQEAR